MTTATLDMLDTFEELNHAHPLYVIRSEREYSRAHSVAKRLSLHGEHLTAGQLRYLDTLAVLMEAYEREHHMKGERPASGMEVLKVLMAEHDMTASDLGRVLGNRQLGAAILRGERELSKAHIATLAGHFGVNPGLFIDIEPRRSKR